MTKAYLGHMHQLHIPGYSLADLLNQFNCIQDEDNIHITYKPFEPGDPKRNLYLFTLNRHVVKYIGSAG